MKIYKYGLWVFLLAGVSIATIAGNVYIHNLNPFRDHAGFIATYSDDGDIHESNPFFQSLGTNGRTCATCHQPDQSFSMSAEKIRARFSFSQGSDPLFAPVDGANCPDANRGDVTSHSLLLNNGLIRVALPLPQDAEFSLTVIRDPYGCAITIDPQTGQEMVSVYRRPLPTTNLGFLSAVMFDGRETIAPLNDEQTFRANLVADLTHQATDAVLGHAQASHPPTQQQLAEIVSLELGFYTAQFSDNAAGPLFAGGANGGPLYLSSQPYYPGINDSLGGDPHHHDFDPLAMTLYAGWQGHNDDGNNHQQARAMIAAGEHLFNTARLHITAVRGLNDNPALGNPPEIDGTCTTCHDTPNVGNHSFPLPLDIGASHPAEFESNPTIAAAVRQLSAPVVPVYLITGCPDPQHPDRLLTFYTSDPGKGLLTGKCADVNRGKGPVLRGLAARAPYFHNGAAANLDELVNFYNLRFSMNLSEEEKQQLIAFLNAL